MSTNDLPSTQKVVLFEENSDSVDVIKYTTSTPQRLPPLTKSLLRISLLV